MKLFHISQSEVSGYDTYSDMVVAAESENEARMIHPLGDNNYDGWKNDSGFWCKSPDQVQIKYLGEAVKGIEKGIICSSFHAG